MTRLPVQALLCCKSVQKSWNRHINTLIRDKTCVAKHLKNSIDRPCLFIVSRHHLPSSEIGEFAFATVCNTNDDNYDNSDHIDTVIENFDISFYTEQHAIPFPGSHSNGIICLRGFGQTYIMLFNPALREFKLLTNSCFGL